MSGWIHVVYVLGAVQGLFLAAVLASRARGVGANRFLAALMAVFSVDLAMAAYHASGTDAALPALIGLDVPLAFLYGPLLYLYVRELLPPATGLHPRDLLHAVPFGLSVGVMLPFYLQSGADKLAVLQAPEAQPWAMAALTPFKIGLGLAYLVAIVVRVRQRRPRVAQTPEARATLRWLRHLTVGVSLLLGLAGVLFAMGIRETVPALGLTADSWLDDVMLLGTTAFVYAVGYLGLRQPVLFAPLAEAVEAPAARPRYARSGMDEGTASQIEADLLALMETEHPYRRGDLTLAELAEALGVSPHNLTEVLNTRLQKSFYDLVNGYRVRDAQARLADPAFAEWTVLAIGMEAGFNAKSSFNAAFKRHTGTTPARYRQRAAAEV